MSKVSNQSRVVNNQQKPAGQTCRRRPGTSFADASALDDIVVDYLEPTRRFVNGLEDGDYLLEPSRPKKRNRPIKTVPAFDTTSMPDFPSS